MLNKKLVTLALLTTTASASSNLLAQERLQPRDLDGNSTTAEAWYDSELNITWLQDTNIGQSDTFGLQRGAISDFGTEVDSGGAMLREALPAFISGMNQNTYLGQSNWRLPTAMAGSDPGCSTQLDDGQISYGSGCTGAEAGSLNLYLENRYGGIAASPFVNSRTSGSNIVGDRWLGSNGPSGRHKFSFGGQGNLSFCGAGRCDKAYVWPVHDGDIGNAAQLPTFADSLLPRDLDGDSSTIEAYYFVPQDITWLAESNLGLTESFGLQRGGFDDDATQVNEDGLIFAESLQAFIDGANQSGYLGASNWRLPIAAADDPGCLRDAELLNPDLEGQAAFGADCLYAEAGEFNQFLLSNTTATQNSPFTSLATQSRVWLGSNGPTGRHSFVFGLTDRGEVGNLGVCPSQTGVRNCQPSAVWLVHDGDIGTGSQPNNGDDTTATEDNPPGSGGGTVGIIGLLFGLLLPRIAGRKQRLAR
jgi:hypothetical protein